MTRTHPRSRITVDDWRRRNSYRSRSIYSSRYGRYPQNLYYRNFYRPYRSSFYAYRPGFHLQLGIPRYGYPYYGFRRYGIYNYTWPTYIRTSSYNPFCVSRYSIPIGYQGLGQFVDFDGLGSAVNFGTRQARNGLLGPNAINPPVLNRVTVPGLQRVLAEHKEKSRKAQVKVIETPEELLTTALIETNRRRPPSSVSARRRSRTDMAFGDRLFGEKKYADALNRYKRAATFAPDIAESFFRQGHAYLASSRLKLAARAFQRGFDVDPDINRKGFKLTELYDVKKNPVPKKLHFDDLARTALQQPRDSEAYLLIGLLLHYDGQADRAQKFFRQADQLPGQKYRFRKLFLPANAKPAKATGIDL